MPVNFEPAPTYANPILMQIDPATGKEHGVFNPVWLKWFLDLTNVITSGGGGSGTLGNVRGTPPTKVGNLPLWGDANGTELTAGSAPFLPTNTADYITTFGDTVDNTTGLNNAIAAAMAGNGMLYVSGYVRADGAVVIPNDGNSPYPKQRPLRIFGGIGGWNNYLTTQTITQGMSVLDLRYNGGGSQIAKIDTRGGGLLEIDHLILLSGGSDDYQFIQTTNTTVQIHHNCIIGNLANDGQTCVQNFCRLGGDGSGANQSLDPQAFFQGYGSKLNDNMYNNIQFAHIYGSQCNGVEVQNETISQTCGSADVHGAPFTFESGPGGGQFAVTIRAGTVEITNYKHVVKMDASTACVFDSISAYDDSLGYYESFVYCDAFSSGALLIATWYPKVPFTGVNKNEQTFLSNAGFRVVHTPTAGRLDPATFLGLGGFQYDSDLSIPIFSDGTIWRDALGAPV